MHDIRVSYISVDANKDEDMHPAGIFAKIRRPIVKALLAGVALYFTGIGFYFAFNFSKQLQSSLPALNIEKQSKLPLHATSTPVTRPVFYPNSTQNATVYHRFALSNVSEAYADIAIRPMVAHSVIPMECTSKWISDGIWPAGCVVKDSVIDLVFTWVNGSDALHQAARDRALTEIGHAVRPKNARFREHDELHYAIRSVTNATSSWKNTAIHIVSADVADPNDPRFRLGLVPSWLNLDHRQARNPMGGTPPVFFHHDSQLMHLIPSANNVPDISELKQWRALTLPTFNSHSIESQLPNLDPKKVSENIVILNDDQLILLEISPSVFHSPLHGPVVQFDYNLQVGDDTSGKVDGGGEWRSLGWSNALLSRRFGSRKRSYVVHNARPFSLPLLHEASLTFRNEFSATPLSRFRGQQNQPPNLEVNTIFIGTHFVIERHREILLWSWIVAKWGSSDGVLDARDKDSMWEELGGVQSEKMLDVTRPLRFSTSEAPRNMAQAGLRDPSSPDPTQANAAYSFVSSDGYASHYLDAKSMPDLSVESDNVICKMKRDECLGPQGEAAWDLFRRILVKKRECGDCVIDALMKRAGPRGLDIFLPAAGSSMAYVPSEAQTLPLVLPAAPPRLPANPREFAIRLIHRYSYALGSLPTRFIGMSSAAQVKNALQRVDREPNLALLCLNDDLPETNTRVLNSVDQVFQEWATKRWPDKVDCEL